MIEQYSNPLVNMCYIYLRDREVAEDALQETSSWYAGQEALFVETAKRKQG